MPEINIANSEGHDARVPWESVTVPRHVRWMDGKQRGVTNRKILRATTDCDLSALEARFGSLDDVARALVDGDPEVNVERFGSFLEDTRRVYVDPGNNVVHHVEIWEIVRDPAGNEKDRRRKSPAEPNVASEVPLRWSGKLFPQEEIFNRFVFSSKVQIVHHNGLTYDFLHTMAKELAEKKSLMLLGAGAKGNRPLIFRRGATGQRGFLEGRVDDEGRYALILHLSGMELKAPEPVDDGEEEQV